MKKEPLTKKAKRQIIWFWVRFALYMVVVILVLGVAVGPIGCSIKKAQQLSCMYTARALDQALHAYANDHNGTYPDGKSSTEVFQQLLNLGYVSDPNIFFFNGLRMPGKVRPESNRLKPENVTWDITTGIDGSAPDDLPVVFLTGYQVNYQAGGSAVVAHGPPKRTWGQWRDDMPAWEPFMAYGCKGGQSKTVLANDDGVIAGFIPADFDAKGKTYRQLTP